MFDTLTDLVEFYKRKGIEEISGNWVYFRQVNVWWRSGCSCSLWWSSNCVPLTLISLLSHTTPPE